MASTVAQSPQSQSQRLPGKVAPSNLAQSSLALHSRVARAEAPSSAHSRGSGGDVAAPEGCAGGGSGSEAQEHSAMAPSTRMAVTARSAK